MHQLHSDTKHDLFFKIYACVFDVLPVCAAWDQSEKFLKLYVTIDGIKSCDADKVKATFTRNGVTLNVTQLQEKNYQLVINNLAKPITQDKSYCKTKDG